MSALQPLLSRDRYTDDEWEFATAGKCGMDVANYPRLEHCGQPSDPASFYRFCTEHDHDAREYPTYGD